MRSAQAILVLASALLLTGCLLRPRQPAAKNLPPAPQPVAKAEPAPPPQPLSIPQTQVELPPPQPVDPDAVAAAELPAGEPVETPSTPPRNPGRRRSAASAPPAPKPEPEVLAPPAAAPPPAENATRIQEILPPDEQKHFQELADNQKREIHQWLDQARARRLTRSEAGRRKTIESLVKLSDQAEALGDMRQASEIAERAWILAKDLQSGR